MSCASESWVILAGERVSIAWTNESSIMSSPCDVCSLHPGNVEGLAPATDSMAGVNDFSCSSCTTTCNEPSVGVNSELPSPPHSPQGLLPSESPFMRVSRTSSTAEVVELWLLSSSTSTDRLATSGFLAFFAPFRFRPLAGPFSPGCSPW